MSLERSDDQEVVDRYFDSEARYWQDVYEREDLQGLIYRQRQETTVRWLREAGFTEGARALDVGSGAGRLSVQLAQLGLDVTGTDSSAEMVELTAGRAREAGVGEHVRTLLADAHQLPFATAEFDLVVGLGLLPWLHDPSAAVHELVRVLRPGGWLILTADNRARLNFLVEPRENPLFAPMKLAWRAARRAPGHRNESAPSHLHLPSQVDRLLEAARVRPLRRTTVGFGPFTFLGRAPLRGGAGLRLHHWLERRAENRAPVLRRLGWHYVVAARKPEG